MRSSTTTISRPHGLTTWRRHFLRDVIHGLRRPQKEVPCKYFYDERGSALFDEICELDEYYLTRTELAILDRYAPEMAAALGADCALIEFGSGSGLKTRLLLDQLQEPRAYLPIDIADEPLERSARELAGRFPGLAILPVHADFTGPLLIPETGDPGARRVVYFPGSTIGNATPDEAVALLRQTADLCGRAGGLVLGADLRKDPVVLEAAYNDRQGITALFNLNILVRINRELGGDFAIDQFAHRAFYNTAEGRIEMHLVSRVPQTVLVAGQAVRFARDETIHTENSYKYAPARMREMVAAAGWTLTKKWSDSNDLFALWLLD